MRTTIAMSILMAALIAGGAVLASAGGVTIEGLIKNFEQKRDGGRVTKYADTGVGRFAQPRLYQSFKDRSQ